MKFQIIIIAVLVACAIHNWGATLGYFTGQYKPHMVSRDHYYIAAVMATAGPFGTVLIPFTSNFYQHGFRWK